MVTSAAQADKAFGVEGRNPARCELRCWSAIALLSSAPLRETRSAAHRRRAR